MSTTAPAVPADTATSGATALPTAGWAAWSRGIGKAVAGGALSGAMVMASFHPLGLWWLGWFAWVPWMLTLPGTGRWGTVLSALAFGGVWFGGCLDWISNLDRDIGWLAFAVTVLVLSLQMAVVGNIWRRVLRADAETGVIGWWAAAIAVSAFVSLEYLKCVANIPLPFPWLQIGATQADFTPLVQVADLGGGYLVTALLIAFNVALVLGWQLRRAGAPWRAALRAPLIMLGVVLAGCIYGAVRIGMVDGATTAGPRVALVQPNFIFRPETGRQMNTRSLFEATSAAIAQKPDLLVWPEAVFFGFVEQPDVPDLGLRVEEHDGRLIVENVSNGPAGALGIEKGDVLLKIGDTAVTTRRGLADALALQTDVSPVVAITWETSDGRELTAPCHPRRRDNAMRGEIGSPNRFRNAENQLRLLVFDLRAYETHMVDEPALPPGRWPYMLLGTSFLINEFHPTLTGQQYDHDAAHLIDPSDEGAGAGRRVHSVRRVAAVCGRPGEDGNERRADREDRQHRGALHA